MRGPRNEIVKRGIYEKNKVYKINCTCVMCTFYVLMCCG